MITTISSSSREVGEVGDLALIFEPGVNVVVLRRALSVALKEDTARALQMLRLGKAFAAPPGEAGRGEVFAELRGLPHLAADISFWSEVLSDLTESALIGVRLARMEAAMCPRFHVDRVTLRVVSTYWGNGTEYLADEDVDRRWLGHAAGGRPDEVSGLMRGRVQVAPMGSLVLLKGEAWPDNLGRGAVHRSPTANSTSPRLVLTLDPL